jgi:cyclopropane fatty-acyl-phospholipid synthase-like methyltransferase
MPLSPRLASILAALPLMPGMRVLEVGCGPGALARAMVPLIGNGFVLGLDRSATAIAQARDGSPDERASGRLQFRIGAIEDFTLGESEAPFDLIVAIRVGALDGRHPVAGARAIPRLRAALRPGGTVLIDGGNPLRTLPLD